MEVSNNIFYNTEVMVGLCFEIFTLALVLETTPFVNLTPTTFLLFAPLRLPAPWVVSFATN